MRFKTLAVCPLPYPIMQAACSSELPAYIHHTTWCHVWKTLILKPQAQESCTKPVQYSLYHNSHCSTLIYVLHSMWRSNKNTVHFTLLCVLMTNLYINLDAIIAKIIDHNLILQQPVLYNSLNAYHFSSLRSKCSPMNVYSMMLQ